MFVCVPESTIICKKKREKSDTNKRTKIGVATEPQNQAATTTREKKKKHACLVSCQKKEFVGLYSINLFLFCHRRRSRWYAYKAVWVMKNSKVDFFGCDYACLAPNFGIKKNRPFLALPYDIYSHRDMYEEHLWIVVYASCPVTTLCDTLRWCCHAAIA